MFAYKNGLSSNAPPEHMIFHSVCIQKCSFFECTLRAYESMEHLNSNAHPWSDSLFIQFCWLIHIRFVQETEEFYDGWDIKRVLRRGRPKSFTTGGGGWRWRRPSPSTSTRGSGGIHTFFGQTQYVHQLYVYIFTFVELESGHSPIL